MKNQIFIDSVFVIALINKRDEHHEQAVRLARQIRGQPLLVTDAILLEVGNALSRNHKQEAVKIIERFLNADEVEVIHLNPDLFKRAFSMYRSFQDKTWGLVDCISFVVMTEAGITSALTFDRHFEQAGFQVLMRENMK